MSNRKKNTRLIPAQQVCYTAVFSVVTQRCGGALRDDTKNGYVTDYRSTYWNAMVKSGGMRGFYSG